MMRNAPWATLTRILLVACIAATTGWAQNTVGHTEANPEAFKIELTGSLWTRDIGGTLASSDTTLNLIGDLGAKQQVQTFFGKLVYKPGYKHRIVVEGTPLHMDGSHTSTQVFTYGNQTFTVSQPLETHADLSYIFAGYQYDLLNGRAGHLGLSAGGAYINATGSISDLQAGETSSKTQQLGLPLAGVEFRVFPIPGHAWVDIDGGIRGMDLGSYGHFVEASLNGGVWIAGHVGLQAGYREITTLLQQTGSDGGALNVHLGGPTFSLLFKY
jgi:hypothetical protein